MVAKYLPKSRLASLASVANVLTLSSLQTLYLMKRRISLKKSLTLSTSVRCITEDMVFRSGFLNLTTGFLAHTDGKVSALVMLGSSHGMVALTSFSTSVSEQDIPITLMSFPKAFINFSSDLQMFPRSVRILRTAI